MNKFIVYTINGLEISLEEYRERNERVLRAIPKADLRHRKN